MNWALGTISDKNKHDIRRHQARFITSRHLRYIVSVLDTVDSARNSSTPRSGTTVHRLQMHRILREIIFLKCAIIVGSLQLPICSHSPITCSSKSTEEHEMFLFKHDVDPSSSVGLSIHLHCLHSVRPIACCSRLSASSEDSIR